MHELCIPLRMEARTAPVRVGGDGRIAVQILGDHDPARKTLAHVLVHVLHQAPAFRNRLAAVPVHAVDVEDHVPAQAVDVVVLKPHHRVVVDELTNLATAVVRASVPPGRLRAVVVVEVDAALVVLLPAIELPQVEIARTEVVVDHIQDDGDAALVRLPDELLEAVRPAIGTFHREDVGGVVAPGVIPCELGDRHDLDGIDPELHQMIQPLQHGLESARPAFLFHMERADMQLIDHELVVRADLEVIALPVESGRIVDYAVTDRIRHLTGIRVDPLQHGIAIAEHELVFLTGLGALDFGIPVAVALMNERVFGL